MRELTIKDAINEALAQEMAADDRVILFGEDIAGGAGRDEDYPEAADAWGGPFGVTQGLLGKFGRRRVIDTAIAETGFVGASVGAAIAGLRPVAEIMYVDFIGTSFDQLLNQAAKLRYVYGGKVSVPMVIRTVVGAGFGRRRTLADAVLAVHPHPGPQGRGAGNAYDAKGLLIAAIRDPDPVIFMEHKRLYMRTSECPRSRTSSRWVRPGSRGRAMTSPSSASRRWSTPRSMRPRPWRREGISCEVIDPRTYSPLDTEAILRSVRKTGRLVVVDESHPRCSLATDIAALVAESAFDSLRAPIRQVTGAHAPVPFSPPLEDLYIPSAERVADACRSVISHAAGGGAGRWCSSTRRDVAHRLRRRAHRDVLRRRASPVLEGDRWAHGPRRRPSASSWWRARRGSWTRRTRPQSRMQLADEHLDLLVIQAAACCMADALLPFAEPGSRSGSGRRRSQGMTATCSSTRS